MSRFSANTSKRIPELDGLRAIAILSVLCHHFWPVSGGLWSAASRLVAVGWMGVDLFFVLSGFFITRILLDARGAPDYFSRFYLRRAKRIMPLYYCVLLGTLAYARFANHGSDYFTLVQSWGNPAWFIFFAANIKSAVINTWPTIFTLTPLWSVQVEEQFYLIYPLVIAFVPAKHLNRTLAGSIAAAFTLRLVLALIFPGFWKLQYALMPCRMDDLAMGALVACAFKQGAWPLRATTTALLATIGVIFIGVMLAAGHVTTRDPFVRTAGYSIIGGTCAMLLAWTLLNLGAPSTSPLRFRPLRQIGQISYGLYLLHGPVAFVVKTSVKWIFGLNIDKAPLGLLAFMVVSIAVAAASYHFFEEPILRSKVRVTS
jgi:peptidoglycan/LPS O-acetylase OafA/YrhL